MLDTLNILSFFIRTIYVFFTVDSAWFRLGEVLGYIKLEGPMLKSYTRKSHKGAYQNRTLGPHKKIKNIYMPFNYLIARYLKWKIQIVFKGMHLLMACLAYA